MFLIERNKIKQDFVFFFFEFRIWETNKKKINIFLQQKKNKTVKLNFQYNTKPTHGHRILYFDTEKFEVGIFYFIIDNMVFL